MSSISRRIARNGERIHLRGVRDDDDWLEIQLFGEDRAPNDECAAERKQLVSRLREFAKWFGKPVEKTLAILRNTQLTYNPDKDGASRAMELLESVDALRAVEDEDRRALAKG